MATVLAGACSKGLYLLFGFFGVDSSGTALPAYIWLLEFGLKGEIRWLVQIGGALWWSWSGAYCERF